jgi:hypothetical protein
LLSELDRLKHVSHDLTHVAAAHAPIAVVFNGSKTAATADNKAAVNQLAFQRVCGFVSRW